MHKYNNGYGTLPRKSSDGGLQKWAPEGLQLVSYCEGVEGVFLETRQIVVIPDVDGWGS